MKIPSLPGVVTAEQVTRSGESIAATQLPSGALPWFSGGHTDPWDHVQSAMALSVTGCREEAERAYEWSRTMQRPDGSWAMRYQDDVVVDPHCDANFCAYLATGVWHHFSITADEDFARRMWPAVDAGIEAVLSLQRPDGAVAWARGHDGAPLAQALITGNASIHMSLRCALALASAVGQPRPEWELAAVRLRHALDHHPEDFESKTTYSMDWYYPVLGGSLPVHTAAERIDARWDEFVVPALGVRCVSTNPWVTGAETCELVLALDAVGRRDAALDLFTAIQHLREGDGSYWTGLVFSDGKRWPVERSNWTAATVILAADALSRTTPANGLFRGERLPDCSWEMSGECPRPNPT